VNFFSFIKNILPITFSRMLSWFLIPYLSYPSDSLTVPSFARDIFPGLVLLTTVIVLFSGFVFCGWPAQSSMTPKRQFRTDTELGFLLFISVAQVFTNSLFLLTNFSLFFLVAFSIEIAFCLWESLYLGRSNRLPVESITHHVCTIFAIPISMYVTDLPLGLLVQLSLSVSSGNVVVCSSKLLYRKSPESKRIKQIGIVISFWVSILYRILIPTVNVGWIMFHFFFRIDPGERPGWTRLYLTSLLMLLALNYQMVSFMKQTRV
jgi:hypothetical protein